MNTEKYQALFDPDVVRVIEKQASIIEALKSTVREQNGIILDLLADRQKRMNEGVAERDEDA